MTKLEHDLRVGQAACPGKNEPHSKLLGLHDLMMAFAARSALEGVLLLGKQRHVFTLRKEKTGYVLRVDDLDREVLFLCLTDVLDAVHQNWITFNNMRVSYALRLTTVDQAVKDVRQHLTAIEEELKSGAALDAMLRGIASISQQLAFRCCSPKNSLLGRLDRYWEAYEKELMLQWEQRTMVKDVSNRSTPRHLPYLASISVLENDSWVDFYSSGTYKRLPDYMKRLPFPREVGKDGVHTLSLDGKGIHLS